MDPVQNPAPVSTPAPAPRTKMSGRTKLALWLLIGPTALFIATFVIYALVNLLTTVVIPPTAPEPGSLFGPTPVGLVIMNVILFIVGVITVITWLPGLIIGIVLLATKPTPTPPTTPTNQ
jgi:hypothetical protein